MTPILQDDWLTLYGGDNREVLRTLPDESVQCVVTSPPYWGLRDYGTASWDGGDPACDHSVGGQVQDGKAPGAITTGQRPGVDSSRCRKCGAIRQDRQLGLEQTPEEYVANMVDVFREVRRVLRKDGTLWLNLGDSYGTGSGPTSDKSTLRGNGHVGGGPKAKAIATTGPRGLKPKDLVGIPWRVAFALQADGWYLRSDIIWAKPNPMPESVTDRPTKGHEYLFLLSRSATYHYDADAVREDATGHDAGRMGVHAANKFDRSAGNTNGLGASTLHTNATARNRRSVWTVATKPYPGAHFATFPEALVEPCILAGCPENGVVLDPFAGTGTVGVVAQRLSRRALLIDLNPDYLRQCLARNQQSPLGLSA
jgi:DNA modification methylase